MVHAADAPAAAARLGRVPQIDDPGAVGEPVPRPVAFGGELLKPEHRGQEARRLRGVALPQLRAVQSADLPLRRHGAPVPRREGTAGFPLDEDQIQPVRIGEREHVIAEPGIRWSGMRAVSLEALVPVPEAALRHLEPDFHGETVAGPRRRHLGPGERT
jgi:hypothetical protein